MRKISVALLLILCLSLTIGVVVSANNAVYNSTTRAYIDGQPIPLYVYKGYPYIVAEDLGGYGFDISWDAYTDILDITYNPTKTWYPYAFEDVYTSFTNERVAEVYASKTKVRLNGDSINAYSLSGRMLISLDDLYRFGHVNYYPESDSTSFTSHAFIAANPDWQTLLPAYLLLVNTAYATGTVEGVFEVAWDALPNTLYYDTVYYVNQGHISKAKNIRAYLQQRLTHLTNKYNFYYKGDFINCLKSAITVSDEVLADLYRIDGHYPTNFNGQCGDHSLDTVLYYLNALDDVISPYTATPWTFTD